MSPRIFFTGLASSEMLTLKLRYKQPGGETSSLIAVPVADPGATMDDASGDMKFASAVAAFGMLLRKSEYVGGFGFEEVTVLAKMGLGKDPQGRRAEFISLVKMAQRLQPAPGSAAVAKADTP